MNTDCGEPDLTPDLTGSDDFRQKLTQLLAADGVHRGTADLDRFVHHLGRSIRRREVVGRRWSRINLDPTDIAFLIQEARDAGDQEEAIWRAFLAAHFGRDSTDKRPSAGEDSAGRLLCGFGSTPKWTWKVVRADPKAMCGWLEQHAGDLRTLSFGNHRKYESKQPVDLGNVIVSFIAVVHDHGGTPATLFTVAPDEAATPEDRFEVLFRRLVAVHRFGRTGSFDLLTFMADMKLLNVEPTSCYLRNSSGPLAGARKLWGKRSTDDLDFLAATLARNLGISPQVVEDALCNWQKKKGEQT